MDPYKLTDNVHVIFTDGRDVVHTVDLADGQEVMSGQPFMISAADLPTLFALFYETEIRDDDGNLVGGTPHPIFWNARFDSAENAQMVCDLLAVASARTVQMRYIKHPNRDEWATPLQKVILNSLPDSEYKQQMLGLAAGSAAAGYELTRAQMEAEGWF